MDRSIGSFTLYDDASVLGEPTRRGNVRWSMGCRVALIDASTHPCTATVASIRPQLLKWRRYWRPINDISQRRSTVGKVCMRDMICATFSQTEHGVALAKWLAMFSDHPLHMCQWRNNAPCVMDGLLCTVGHGALLACIPLVQPWMVEQYCTDGMSVVVCVCTGNNACVRHGSWARGS